MSFTNKVDYIPNQPFSHSPSNDSDHDIKKHQRQKWLVLFGTFFLVIIIGNLWIWTQPAIFHSQAILHFSYPSETELEYSQLAERKMGIHQQRLTSNSVLQQTQEKLAIDTGIQLDIQAIGQLLSAQVSGRIITLTAQDKQPEILEQVISSWISVYTEIVENERLQNSTQELLSSNTQLQTLNKKIQDQKFVIAEFANAHNITSLERDENRVLSKIRALSTGLDKAIADQTTAQARLNSLRESEGKEESIVRDTDKAQINQTRQALQTLSNELTLLREKYTQAYLDRDPSIVRKLQAAEKLKVSLAAQIQESETLYLQEAERNLAAAVDKVEQTKSQFNQQNAEAQAFSQKLQEYKILNDDLIALQDQAKNIRSQQVRQEVSQPFDAKISVLEPAYTPEFPSGPDYWTWTLICLLAALGLGIFALLLFGYIMKQKQTPAPATNFVVMPGHTVAEGYNANQLAQAQTAQLVAAQPSTLSLADKKIVQIDRVLTFDESKALINIANLQGKLIISLVYAGLNKQEIFDLKSEDLSGDYRIVNLKGASSRSLQMAPPLAKSLEEYFLSAPDGDVCWTNIQNLEDLDHVVANLAHDAGLAEADNINLAVIRHTYIAFLVSQGCRLNDLEKIVGAMPPSELSQYRNVTRLEPVKDLADLNYHYPLFS